MKTGKGFLILGVGLLAVWLVLSFATAVIAFLLPVAKIVGLGCVVVGGVMWLAQRLTEGKK